MKNLKNLVSVIVLAIVMFTVNNVNGQKNDFFLIPGNSTIPVENVGVNKRTTSKPDIYSNNLITVVKHFNFKDKKGKKHVGLISITINKKNNEVVAITVPKEYKNIFMNPLCI